MIKSTTCLLLDFWVQDDKSKNMKFKYIKNKKLLINLITITYALSE